VAKTKKDDNLFCTNSSLPLSPTSFPYFYRADIAPVAVAAPKEQVVFDQVRLFLLSKSLSTSSSIY